MINNWTNQPPKPHWQLSVGLQQWRIWNTLTSIFTPVPNGLPVRFWLLCFIHIYIASYCFNCSQNPFPSVTLLLCFDSVPLTLHCSWIAQISTLQSGSSTWPTSNKKHFVLTFLRFHYRLYAGWTERCWCSVNHFFPSRPPHLHQRPAGLESSDQSPPSPPPPSEEAAEQRAQWWRSLSWNNTALSVCGPVNIHPPHLRRSPDVQLLAAAGFSNSRQSEAPLLPHGGRHLRIQPPNKDTATHKTKARNSLWV